MKKDEYQEVIKFLNEIEKKQGLQKSEIVIIHFYKAISLARVGNYPETLKYAKKVYRLIGKQEPTSQLIETLITLGHASCWLGNFDTGYQYLDEAEQKLNELTNISENSFSLFIKMAYIKKPMYNIYLL